MLKEEPADRTLPPSERRRREARMRGQVAQSPELTAAIVLLAASVSFWYLAPLAANGFVGLLRSSMASVPRMSLTIDAAVSSIQLASGVIVTALAPILLLALVGGTIANLAQTGWLWTPSTIVPRFRGLRLISGDSAIAGLATWMRIGALGSVCASFLMTNAWRLRSIGLDEPMSMLVQPARMLGELTFELAVTLVLLAIADYGLRYWRHEQRLKMTFEERRQEQREEAGDPQLKKRRADGRRSFSASVSMSEVGRVDRAQL